MFKCRVWIAAAIICLLYWGTWHGYTDDPKTQFKANTVLRHAIDFMLLISVALTGWYGWKKHWQPWILQLWIFIYAVVILSIGALGAIDMYLGIHNLSFRNMLSNLRLFFTSPVPFGVLVFFAKKGEKLSSDKNGFFAGKE
jgi:CDP-diglyceride synthetase